MDQEIKDLLLSDLVVAGAAAAAVVVSSLAMMSDFETWCSGTEEPDCQWHSVSSVSTVKLIAS